MQTIPINSIYLLLICISISSHLIPCIEFALEYYVTTKKKKKKEKGKQRK